MSRKILAGLAAVLVVGFVPEASATPPGWSERRECVIPLQTSVFYGCADGAVYNTDPASDCKYRNVPQGWKWTCRVMIRQSLCAEGTLIWAYFTGSRTDRMEATSQGGMSDCKLQDTFIDFVPEVENYDPRIEYSLCAYAETSNDVTCNTWIHDIGPMPHAPSLDINKPELVVQWASDSVASLSSYAEGLPNDLAQEPR